jgi:hypothetical protein
MLPNQDMIYNHGESDDAREQMEDLKIGRIAPSKISMFREIDSMIDPTNPWKLSVFNLITEDTARFGFKLEGVAVKSFHQGLEYLGRHFLVTAKNNNSVSRYYTIANCMNSRMHEKYLQWTEAITKGDKTYSGAIKVSDIPDSETLDFIVKKY